MLLSTRTRSTVRGVSKLLVVAMLGTTSSVMADGGSMQRQELAAALRQLGALELLVTQSAAALPEQVTGRYHFDYPRLLDDLSRVRTGIEAYLAPSRAQPRDVSQLAGDYRRDNVPHQSPQSEVDR